MTALENLSAGDPIQLKQVAEGWVISDCDGVQIGRLAKKFSPPGGASFIEGTVFAVRTPYRSDSAEEYQPQLNQDQWTVMLPELIHQA